MGVIVLLLPIFIKHNKIK